MSAVTEPCSECKAPNASWVSFNVGEETTQVCLCEKCIQELTQLGVAVKPAQGSLN